MNGAIGLSWSTLSTESLNRPYCRATRSSDPKLYENEFRCEVRNYDPAPVLILQSKLKMPFSEHPMFIYISSIHRDINYHTWDNLVSWLRLCHKRKCPSFLHGMDCISDYGRDAQAEMSVLLGLFEVVERCPE